MIIPVSISVSAKDLGYSVLNLWGKFSKYMQKKCALSSSDTSHHFDSQDALYDAISQVLGGEFRGRIIRHAHIKTDSPGHPQRGIDNPIIQGFISQFESRIRNSGPNTWQVWQFYVVTQFSRLDVIENRIRDNTNKGARGWTVKVWPVRAVFPNLSPLVVGDEDAFLALDDVSSPHVSEGLHIRGRPSVTAIEKYFDSFFLASSIGDSPIFTIRNEKGIQENELALLREFMVKKKFK